MFQLMAKVSMPVIVKNRASLFFVAVVFLILTGCTKRFGQAIEIEKEERNPWTHLRFRNQSENFQFAIVGDRSALPRPGVFAKAVERLNSLQPEFVMSVGDFIGGFTREGRVTEPEKIKGSWSEFELLIKRLEMPFFYVAGNNDINSPPMLPFWQERFGRTYYSFLYRDVLFVALNSDDPPGSRNGDIGEAQLQWLGETLGSHSNVRWTMVFLHRPLWQYSETRDLWAKVEATLRDRSRTVFAGHLHQYARSEVNGHIYYSLATTGGISDLTGIRDGSFDHIVWVTMTEKGPRLTNLMLDGIWGDNPAAEAISRDEPTPSSQK